MGERDVWWGWSVYVIQQGGPRPQHDIVVGHTDWSHSTVLHHGAGVCNEEEQGIV